jgi:Protein of Unknown function (DUF2784)
MAAMSPRLSLLLAELVLAFHVAVILFNLFGMIAIPIGGRRGWNFVRIRWWRLLHLGALAIVALQALLGRACFLTLWQQGLSGKGGGTPLLMGLVDRLIFWPLPMAFFVALYVLVFLYVVLLLWLVPPR